MEKKINLFEAQKKSSNKNKLQTTTVNESGMGKVNLLGNNLNKASKPIKNKTNIDLNYVKQDRVLNFYKLKNTNSKITCHGRPTQKQVRSMKQIYKVNFCLTLQKQKENPEDIRKYCVDNGIDWQLIELDGANIAYLKKKDVLSKIIESLYSLCIKLITENIVLFIHCAAGLHRTGTILYSLLRVFGESPENAMIAIGIIREETQRQVGKERIRIAENVIFPELLKKLQMNNWDPQGASKEAFTAVSLSKLDQENQISKNNANEIIVKEDILFRANIPMIKSEVDNIEERLKLNGLNQMNLLQYSTKKAENSINNNCNSLCKLPENDINPSLKAEEKVKIKQIFENLDC